jgi:RNA polymerase sigma factor (sigma-70 family)
MTSIQVRRAIAGDASSVGWLAERLSPVLVAQASWRLGPLLRPHYDPEDLVADAWLRLLPHLPELSPRDGRFSPVVLRFLATAIVNRVNNLVKRHLRRKETAGTPDSKAPSSEPSPFEQVSADVTGAITAAMKREQHHAVAAAIEELDPKDREIVMLRGIEQRSNSTVAELLGITADAAAMRYHRALARLRARLPGSVFDEID